MERLRKLFRKKSPQEVIRDTERKERQRENLVAQHRRGEISSETYREQMDRIGPGLNLRRAGQKLNLS